MYDEGDGGLAADSRVGNNSVWLTTEANNELDPCGSEAFKSAYVIHGDEVVLWRPV